MTPGLIGFVIIALAVTSSGGPDPVALASAGCGVLILSLGAYLVWTHRVFSRTSAQDLKRVLARQQALGPSRAARLAGMTSAEGWALSVALAALAAAVIAAVLSGSQQGALLAVLAVLTAAVAWITVVYSFALRYLRLHAAGDPFRFDVHGEPDFSVFLASAVMISSAGAISGATPTTKAGLRAVRTHTVIAFAFNALVIAVTVSLISGLLATSGQ